jgi:hypothetical protein
MACSKRIDVPIKKKIVPVRARRRDDGVKGPKIHNREDMEIKQNMVTSQQANGVHSNTMMTNASIPLTVYA